MGKRKNSTKKERTELLKRLGYTEAEMQQFWDECVLVNKKVEMLHNAGLNWTDLCVWQIEKLPTLKDETLRKIAEMEEKLKKNQELKEIELKAIEDYEKHFEEIMVSRIDKSEPLTEKELSRLVSEYEVETYYGSNRRWSRTVTTIVEMCNRLFRISWEEGLTEEQCNSYSNQPVEVFRRRKIVVSSVVDYVDDLSEVKAVPNISDVRLILNQEYKTDYIDEDNLMFKVEMR